MKKSITDIKIPEYLDLFEVEHKYVDLSIIECGREQCASEKVVGALAKRYFTIHYVNSGSGIIRYGDKTKTLRAGDVFVIYPWQMVEYQPDKDNPWCYSWVVFEGLQAEYLTSRTTMTPDLPYKSYKSVSDIGDIFNKLVQVFYQSEITAECVGYLYILLAKLASPGEKSSRTASPKQEYVKNALIYIHFNYMFDIEVADVARSLNISTNYLYNIFHEAIGVSPKQYITAYRIKRARYILETASYKIKDVAMMVGYRDQLHFSRIFKECYGVSPKEYILSSEKIKIENI